MIEREVLAADRPQQGEVLLRNRAIGLNFIDAYRRSGLYPVELPSGMGTEAAGEVLEIGPGVSGFNVGDRVAYATGPLGAYSTIRCIPADHLIQVPAGVTDQAAAAGLLKGMTACFLVEQCAQARAQQTALVHAAAGGVGSLLVQWLRDTGVRVIAHSGSAEKAAMAQSAGAWESLSCPMSQLGDAVRDLTAGRGAEMVFDGVGASSWEASLGSLAKRGLLVSYGNASGPVGAVDLLSLMRAGSVFLTRPTLADYAVTPAERRHLANRLFERLADGSIEIEIGQTFGLADAAEAHRRLEARQTVGSSILTP